jgi:hypothetical protein
MVRFCAALNKSQAQAFAQPRHRAELAARRAFTAATSAFDQASA